MLVIIITKWVNLVRPYLDSLTATYVIYIITLALCAYISHRSIAKLCCSNSAHFAIFVALSIYTTPILFNHALIPGYTELPLVLGTLTLTYLSLKLMTEGLRLIPLLLWLFAAFAVSCLKSYSWFYVVALAGPCLVIFAFRQPTRIYGVFILGAACLLAALSIDLNQDPKWSSVKYPYEVEVTKTGVLVRANSCDLIDRSRPVKIHFRPVNAGGLSHDRILFGFEPRDILFDENCELHTALPPYALLAVWVRHDSENIDIRLDTLISTPTKQINTPFATVNFYGASEIYVAAFGYEFRVPGVTRTADSVENAAKALFLNSSFGLLPVIAILGSVPVLNQIPKRRRHYTAKPVYVFQALFVFFGLASAITIQLSSDYVLRHSFPGNDTLLTRIMMPIVIAGGLSGFIALGTWMAEASQTKCKTSC